MKPLSAFYFLKENRSRCVLLIFMIFLSFGVYIGGLYITNPLDNWSLAMEYYENIVSVSGSDYEDEDYRYVVDKAISEGKVSVIELAGYNGLNWETIMGFGSGNFSFTFRSVDDFRTYCECMEISCNYEKLNNGSMIMSERFANNKGIELGDKIDKNFYSEIYGEYVLDEMTDEDGYCAYFIANEEQISASAIFIGEIIHGDELYDYVYGLQSEVADPLDVYVYGGIQGDIGNQFEMFNIIYIFIAILLSIILALTINAAFVGMYQRREHEFAIYRAIGLSRKRIIGKIVGELVLMDVVALVIGAAVTMLGLYLFNNMVLYPVGKYLRYFDNLALGNLLLCNIIIVVPLSVTRCKQMLKADICKY